MKLPIIAIAAFLLFSFGSACPNGNKDIVVSAKVLEIAPNPNVVSSSITFSFRFARYEINDVCKGKLRDKEIIAAHMVADHQEFSNIKIGQNVVLNLTRIKESIAMSSASKESDLSQHADVHFVAKWASPDERLLCGEGK
jgi:hypothetical protein